MVAAHAPAPQSPAQAHPSAPPCRRIGVGIDTARYGHYAAFLSDDLQPAAAELAFAETAAGYAQLRQRLQHIAQRHAPVHFLIRLDAAGQYADNLLQFLHGLATPAPHAAAAPAPPPPLAQAEVTISCGDPERNKNYRVALFGKKKSDPIEARAAARFAISERPKHTPALPPALRTLRQVAGRLQAVVRQRTRLINQFHQLLALTCPELALVVKNIAVGWLLELVHRYPSATLLAAASADDLATIPYLPQRHIAPLLEHARSSVASLQGPIIEQLVRDQVRQLRDVAARQKRLEKLLVDAYRQLPFTNHLDTIPGFGAVTAAILTAFILDIDRFDHPGKLVAYFGTLPIEVSSGVERDGQPRGPKRYVMSRRGNDLVRRYLWMAALSAIRYNPAVRALYARVVAKHPEQKAIAVGHGMRKLLHLAFAIWKTGKPFDPEHFPWQAGCAKSGAQADDQEAAPEPANAPPQTDAARPSSDIAMSQDKQAAGHKRKATSAQPVVTAACALPEPEDAAGADIDEHTPIDFQHLKRQLPLALVLDHLGLSARLRGSGPQRRGPCPIHRSDARGRTFSVHLDNGVFHCFDKACDQQGDVIDLWASVHSMSLREAALDLVRTFGLEPVPQPGTEKRNG